MDAGVKKEKTAFSLKIFLHYGQSAPVGDD